MRNTNQTREVLKGMNTLEEKLHYLDSFNPYNFVIINFEENLKYEFTVYALDEVKAYEFALEKINPEKEDIYDMY